MRPAGALLLLLALPFCAGAAPYEPIQVTGYSGDLMEPSLSPDGRTLFFNNGNQPGANTDLHWAERLSQTAFHYRGPLAGANSPLLDAVPSLAGDGWLYFISTRAVAAAGNTVYRGRWRPGLPLAEVGPVAGLRLPPGELYFDVAAAGADLLLSKGVFTGGATPERADLAWFSGARRRFLPLLDRLNTPDGLEYAASLSPDRLEVSFTRWNRPGLPQIYRASRKSTVDAFGPARRLEGLQTLVEAPAYSPDGRWLYYHAKTGSAPYSLFRVDTRRP